VLCGFILFTLISVWGGAHSARLQRLRIAELMSKGEYDRAGLAKLSDGEREALDEWLTRYTDGLAAESRHGRTPEPPGLEGKDRVEICGDSPVPRGWVKVNDRWNPTKCGSPTSIVYNVWEVERYANKPVGAEMEVCADAPTPPGWAEINSTWSPTKCGHPTKIVDNVKRIKRLR
jgi:hypothetical protein